MNRFTILSLLLLIAACDPPPPEPACPDAELDSSAGEPTTADPACLDDCHIADADRGPVCVCSGAVADMTACGCLELPYGCSLQPPGVCWCGPGCALDDPPDVGCTPVDDAVCEAV